MTPEAIKDWTLTSLREKLIKIGAKVVSHGRYVMFQGTIAADRRPTLAPRLPRRHETCFGHRLMPNDGRLAPK